MHHAPSRRFTLLIAIAALALSALPTDAHAIPPFARKYGVSCALCHQPVPRLTPFGEAFAANGFEFAVGEAPRDTIGTGDPLLRLQRTMPLGVRIDTYMRFLSKKAAGEVTHDQQTPWVVKLLSGGQVGPKISYYFYFLASEGGEIGGLEDAYLQFTDIKGSGVSLMVGQFQVSDPLFKRELRLGYEDYEPYRVRVGYARADLTYDRGLAAFWSPREGTDLVFQVVNGRGLDEADDSHTYDTDANKALSLRASQDIGPVRLGVFGYASAEWANGRPNRMRYFGPDATVSMGSKTELNLQLLRRWDVDPFFGDCSLVLPCPGGANSRYATRVDAAMGEVIYSPQGPLGRWFVSSLFNYVASDAEVVSLRLGEPATAQGFITRYRTASVGLHYLLRRNMRMMGEGMWDLEREQLRVVTGFVLGF